MHIHDLTKQIFDFFYAIVYILIVNLKNLKLKKVYSTEYSFAHCTIAVSKITKSSGDPY